VKNQCRQESADYEEDPSCSSELSFVNVRPIVTLDTKIGAFPPVKRPLHADKLVQVFEVADQGLRESVIVLSRCDTAGGDMIRRQQEWFGRNAKFVAAAIKHSDCELEGVPFVASYIELLSKVGVNTPGKLREVTNEWLLASVETTQQLDEDARELGLVMMVTPSLCAAAPWFGEYRIAPFAFVDAPWQTKEQELLATLSGVQTYVRSLYWLIGGLNLFESDEEPALLSRWSTGISVRSAEILRSVIDDEGTDFAGLRNELKKSSVSSASSSPRPSTAQPDGRGLAKVIGRQKVKQTLSRIVAEKHATNLLLIGPSGCGKTLIAKSFADELGVMLMLVRPSDIISMFVGESIMRLRRVFDEAIANAPCVLFFDEVEFLAPDPRVAPDFRTDDVKEFLIGVETAKENGVFVVAATNLPFKMDSSIFRGGRFDKIMYVGPCDEQDRVDLFEHFLQGRATSEDLDLTDFIEALDGYSPADLRSVAQECLEISTSLGKCPVSPGIFSRALNTVKASVSSETEQQFTKFIERGYS
jgi:hypothetical protein